MALGISQVVPWKKNIGNLKNTLKIASFITCKRKVWGSFALSVLKVF